MGDTVPRRVPGRRSHDNDGGIGHRRPMAGTTEYALLTALVCAAVGLVGGTVPAAVATFAPRPEVPEAVTRSAEPVGHRTTLVRPGAVARAHHDGAHVAPARPALRIDTVGDVRTARHVTVLVPGTGATAATHPALVRRARALAAEMRGHDPSVAVVAWTGYHAPTSLVSAAGDTHAERGAALLVDYLDDLRRRATPGVHVTVIGHSYGAVVATRAAAAGAAMDDLVLVGAPGFGRGLRNAADLGRPDLTVWSVTNHDDPIRLLHTAGDATAVHGGDTAAPDAGTTRVPTTAQAGVDGIRPGSVGHSGYFDVGSAGLANLARVATGVAPERAPPPHRRPVGPP
jgi:hypothetical protein